MAELKLRVSLDTSYLKGQISRLPLEFAGANVSIRPKFDRRAIVSEFQLLNRYIGGKKFNVVINTNLEAEIKNADRLIKALGKVQQAAGGAKGGLPIGTQVLSRTKAKGGFAAAEIKALFGAAVQGGLIDDKTLAATRAQMVAALGSIGKDSIAGLLNGLKSGDADIQAAAQMLGSNLITSFKTVLGIASPSKEFKKLGEAAGQGFEQGLLKSIEIAEQSATRKMQRMLDRLARMALIMSGISGPEIGRQIAQARALPSLNFGATTPRTPIGIGPSSTGRALPPGRAAAGMITAAQAPAGLLPGRASASSVLELNNILAGAIREYFKAVAREVELQSKTIGRTSISTTPLLSQSRVAGLLPGRPSPASTLELNNILAGAIREYFKSVAREIDYKSSLAGKASIPATPLLEQSRIAGLLPSRPSAASTLELNNILAGAIREYFKAVARELKGVGKAPLSKVPLLPPASRQNAPMLPPIGGTSGSIRISTGAYVGQPPMMRAPSVPPPMGGGGVPPAPPRGGGGGGGSFGGMQFNVPKLPGAGLVREIGEEFGFAAKQVLLYGTAYKALGLLQAFPAQVGEAVGALQTFRNTIGEISPSAKEAAESSQFILDIVEKYNTPLQSARDGFVKLYASMQPAGFSGDEIRDLFLGISQTAATFGMSADKVDRVNYAFAQMASKGQVMSEELKGQLGDVLPGAMAIFAEAAGFKGPEAITKFSKALEDGAYKGGAMKTLLTNVGSIMRKEFGPGAEGAARTFQGVMNRMQNSVKLLYEAFEPVAVGFLNSVVMPMTSGLKTVTDGFNAFFTKQAAQTAGGSAFAKQLEALRPAFEGIAANIKQILPLLQSFASTALSLGQVLLQIAGNPFVGYLARIYLSVLPLTMALRVLNLQALIPLIASFLRAIPAFVTFNGAMISGTSANKGLQFAMQLTGQTASVTAGKIRLVGAALATLGTTAILVGIGLLIERFMMMKSAIDGVKQSTQQMLTSISGMANSGAVKELENVSKNIQKQKATFNELKEFVSGGVLGGGKKELTQAMADKFKEVGMGSFVSKSIFGKPIITDFLKAAEIIDAKLQGLNKESSSVTEKLPMAQRIAADIAKQAKTAESAASSQSVTGEDDADKNKTSLESYYSLRDQLTKDATEFAAAQAEEESRHRISLLELYYDTQEARANAYQKDALKFEREMVMIEERRQESRLKAQLEVQKAQGSVAGGAMSGGAGGTGAIFGATGRTFNAPGWVHGHFQNQDREALVKDTVEVVMELLSKGVSPELGSGARFTAGMNAKQVEALVRKGIGSHKQYASGVGAIDVFMPKGTQVPVPVSGIKDLGGAAGVTGSLPRGSQLMHLDPASTVNVAGGGMVPGKVAPSVKRNEMATQNTLQASIAQTTANRMADERAVKEQIATLEKYRAVAFPTIEQDTQNKLLAKRNELFRSGLTSDQVDQEIKLYENQQRGAAALASVQRLYDNGYLKLDAYTKLMEIFNQDIASQNDLLQQNAAYLRQSQFDQAMKGVRNQIDMARALTPEQEMRTQIAQEGLTGAEAESIFQERKTLQSAEKLKADMQGIAGAIGDSFGNAFKGVITGSMTAQEALAGFFQSVADSFADMVAKMIAEYLKMALIKGIMALIPGLGAGAGGGLSNLSAPASINNPLGDLTGIGATYANGGIAPGGFTAFANGGVVTGPTLGLVGEGRYNEAVIPLPDGKSVPVQLSGGDGGNQINSNITVNVSNGQAQSNATGSNSSELGRKIEGAVKQVIVGELRPGGLLASR